MQQNISLIIYYQKRHIFSFNALMGAIEIEKDLKNLPIFFTRGKHDLFKVLSEKTRIYQKIILAISFFTTEIWEIIELVLDIKQAFGKKVLIVAGGPHPTGDPLGTLKMGINIVIVGEGEETFIELIKALNNGENIQNIKGIALFDENNEYVYTGRRKPIDLNKYPLLPTKNIRFGALEITRGCPFACSFCQTSFIFGTTPRHRDIDKICNAVKFMARYNKTDIRFITPNAFSYGSKDGKELNVELVEKLLIKIKTIIGHNGRIFFGSFPSEVRPEHVCDDTLKLVKKYANNDNIVIGAQTGSEKLLKFCNRGHSVEDIYNAVENITKYGLKAYVDFIFCLPGEDEDDVDLTIKLMNDLIKLGAKIHGHIFIPLPGTPFAKSKIKKITSNFKTLIINLNYKGVLFGDWKKQEELALKISRYYQT
ncbi:MAG: TIGR04013 family B12-binding domain/radical SAM domain-containing protein [Promethearchaeota archaeon]